MSTKSTKKINVVHKVHKEFNVVHKEAVSWAGQGAGCQGGQCVVKRCPQSPQRSLTLSTKSTKKFNVVHKEGVFWAAKALGVKVGSVLLIVVHKDV